MPKRDFYLLNHPEFIEEVLVKQQANFIKGPKPAARTHHPWGRFASPVKADEHPSQRRALQPAFHRTKMEEYLPVMGVSAFKHLARWQHGSVVDMSDEMMRLTLNIALWSFFGSAPEGSVERVSEAMKTLIRLFPLAQLPLPEATRMLFPKFRQAKADLNIVTETLLANPQSEQAQRALINILKTNTATTHRRAASCTRITFCWRVTKPPRCSSLCVGT
ncbi:cytochrome P450 [Candidatus Villigracilis affinis]|uniref:cytochrome P450 n=1 Tax=Candidatus Villigracilis affinis TaxID=3140682 RepID=UPI002A1CC4A6|nr:cytochrome P450 [Anaerolineales bacterium]